MKNQENQILHRYYLGEKQPSYFGRMIHHLKKMSGSSDVLVVLILLLILGRSLEIKVSMTL